MTSGMHLLLLFRFKTFFGCFLVFCSFSSFNFQKHGNSSYGSPHNAPGAERSSQGKMEKSFLRYVLWSSAFLDIYVVVACSDCFLGEIWFLGIFLQLFWFKYIPEKMSTAFPWCCREGSLVWAAFLHILNFWMEASLKSSFELIRIARSCCKPLLMLRYWFLMQVFLTPRYYFST